MKNITLIVFLSLSVNLLYSQKTWQEVTKLADSTSIVNYSKAIEFRKKAVELAVNESKEIKMMLNYLLDFSETELQFIDPKNYTKSYKELKKIVANLEKLDLDPSLYLQTRINLLTHSFNHLFNINDSDKIVTKLLKILYNAKQLDTFELIYAHQYESLISKHLNNLPKSITAIKKSIHFSENYTKRDTVELGSLYLNYADIYNSKNLNIPNKSYQLLEKSEQLLTATSKPDLMYLSAIYIRLSKIDRQYGNYKKALGYLNKNRKIIKDNLAIQQSYQRGNVGVMKELQYYQFLIGTYRELGDEKKMLSALDDMNKIAEENELSEYGNYFLSVAYRSTGEFYKKRNPKKALGYLNKGLYFNTKYKFLNTELDHKIVIAKTYFNQKKYDKSLFELKKILQRKTLKTNIKTKTLSLFAGVYFKKNNLDSSFYYANKCINEIAKNKKNLDLKTMHYNDFQPGNSILDASLIIDIAEIYGQNKTNYNDEVTKLYWIAFKQFNSLFNDKIVTKKLALLFERILNGVINNCMNSPKSTEKIKLVLSSIENVKSRNLLNNYLHNRTLASTDKFNDIIEKEQEIRATITYLTKKFDQSKDEKLIQLIFEEELKLKEIIEKTQKSFLNPSFDINNLKLTKNTLAIRFKKAGDYYYAFRVSENNLTIHKISAKDLEEKVTAFNTIIKDLNVKTEKIKTLGNDLFKLLLNEKDLTNKNLYIIPDDILHYLPFELLSFQQKYLIEYITTSYNNGLTFINPKKNTRSKNKVALFAPSYNKFAISDEQLAVRGAPYSLIGAREEIKAISNIIKKTEFYDGDLATKKTFMKLSKDISVIHLSMHSFLNDEIPELNSLIFSDKTNDNELYISELYGLKLNADLAVLSACNTGVGKLKDGKGIVAMNSAFTYAGVPTTISSLWSAPDQSTKEIMIDFYKNLKQKQTISQSLRNAKLNYLNKVDDAQLKHPYYWAGFVLYGNDAIIPLNNDVNYLKWIGIFFLLVLLLFILKKYFKKH